MEGQLCSEIPCLVAWGSPAVWAREVCLSNEPSIRAIFSHTNITGRAIPIYRSDSVSLSTHHHFSESHRKFRNAGSSQGQGVMLSAHRLTERGHCGSVELHGWLTATVLRDLDQAWTLKTAEQDEKHRTVQRSKLEPMATVTIIKYCVCHLIFGHPPS